jgi:GDP-mannose transporter
LAWWRFKSSFSKYAHVTQVLSSVIAGWADISTTLSELVQLDHTIIGYVWMASNCFSSAAFVLFMRKRIKMFNFKDFDTVYYNNLLSIPLLIIPSLLFENWSSENFAKNLYVFGYQLWGILI